MNKYKSTFIIICIIIIINLVYIKYLRYKYIPERLEISEMKENLEYQIYTKDNLGITLFYPTSWVVEDNDNTLIMSKEIEPYGSLILEDNYVADIINPRTMLKADSGLKIIFNNIFGYSNGAAIEFSFKEKIDGIAVTTTYSERYDKSGQIIKTMGYSYIADEKLISVLYVIYDNENYDYQKYFNTISRSIYLN